MKKILCLFFSVIFTICSFGALAEDNEIEFLGIPWLSDESTTFQTLLNKGYIRSLENTTMSREVCVYLSIDESGKPSLSLQNNDDNCTSVTFNRFTKGRIAGYSLANLSLTFAYNGEYQLLFAKVDLLNADCEDIKNKLIRVYGNSEEIEKIGEKIHIWKGKNNSCVVLFEYSDGMSFDLCYGRIDAEEILQKCKAPADPDDVSGL